MLDVPLLEQTDGFSCGHHAVAMVARYHARSLERYHDLGYIDPFDPRITRYERERDRVLDSFGVALALRDISKDRGGGVFYLTDSLTELVDTDGQRSPQCLDMQARRKELMSSPCAFTMEYVKYRDKGNGSIGDDHGPERFPDPMDLGRTLVDDWRLPSIAAVEYRKIDPGAVKLHNLVITGFEGDQVFANNSGPAPRARKDQRIDVPVFREAWPGADYDLVVLLPDSEERNKFFAYMVEFVVNYKMACWVNWLSDHFFDSVVRTCRRKADVVEIVRNRRNLMIGGPTKQRLTDLLNRLERTDPGDSP